MTLWHIAWSYLWNRKLTTCLTIASVALAVGLISSVLTLREETRRRFEEEGQLFDVVVGAKGSPLQLVLSAIYFMDKPTGNILYSDYERLRKEEDVVAAYPISLGDRYQEFQIVGTVAEVFAYAWGDPITGKPRNPFHVAKGRAFERSMEAVVGSTVARETGLKVDDSFHGVHGSVRVPEGVELPDGTGIVHKEFPYHVVGILRASGTPFDRAIFCNLESVWEVHGHHEEGPPAAEEYHGPLRPGVQQDDTPEGASSHGTDEQRAVTAVLIDLVSTGLRFQFEEYVNESYNAMAARPVDQIANLYSQLLGTAKMVLLAIGYLVVIISALSILIGLYLSILQRKRDLAIMRALGASSYEILGAVLIEALWVTLLGIVSGWLLGGLVTSGISVYLVQRFGLYIQAFTFTRDHLLAFGTVAFMGLVAGILPAWQAYQTDVARDLSHV